MPGIPEKYLFWAFRINTTQIQGAGIAVNETLKSFPTNAANTGYPRSSWVGLPASFVTDIFSIFAILMYQCL